MYYNIDYIPLLCIVHYREKLMGMTYRNISTQAEHGHDQHNMGFFAIIVTFVSARKYLYWSEHLTLT